MIRFDVGLFAAMFSFIAPAWAVNNASIGVATSIGSVSVNRALVSGRTDLRDGSRLETTASPTDVHLASGADLRLATRSAGDFYSDHVELGEGALRVGNFSGLTVNARQLAVTSDEAASQAVIRITRKTVDVASVGGAVNVMDGGLMTRVAAGTKMTFQQSGAMPAGQQPVATGAAPAQPKTRMPSDEKTFLWVIGITAVAALAIGLTAAAQGKSPF